MAAAAVLVLGELVDDAVDVVGGVDQDDGDRGPSCLDGGKGAALPGQDDEAPVGVGVGDDRFDHAALTDRADEVPVDPRVEAHVRADDQGRGVGLHERGRLLGLLGLLGGAVGGSLGGVLLGHGWNVLSGACGPGEESGPSSG